MEHFNAWNSADHLENFSEWSRDLEIYRNLRNRQIYGNLGRCISEVIDHSAVINELGVGGGRSFQYFRWLTQNASHETYDYLGYDIAPACVDFCKEKFGNRFELIEEDGRYRPCDLFYFFDVLVHAPEPLRLIEKVGLSAKKYLCFQTPTRDCGQTEFDVEKSCRLENGVWVPWIVFNVDELIGHLRDQGFERFLVLKTYKQFAGGGNRYLPREFFDPETGSARTAICAIKHGVSDGLDRLQKEIEIIKVQDETRIPLIISIMNKLFRKIQRVRTTR